MRGSGEGFRRVGRHGRSGQPGQGWPASASLLDRQSEACQAEGGERPVHGGRHERSGHWAAVVNHRELSRPDLGKEILLEGRFYEAQMDWDMIVGYDFMMETDSGVLPAQASMTLYQDDQLSWLSSPEHHVECQWIHPERNQPEVAVLGTEPAGPANQKYGVMPEVAKRVVADLRASDLALDAFSSGTSAHLWVCEKYWSAQDSAWKKH